MKSKVTAEDARQDWLQLVNAFRTEHAGKSTEITVFEPDRHSQLEEEGLPLVGISVDLTAGEATTMVMLGKGASDHLTHAIPRTTRITLLSSNQLEIEAADRSRSLVRCWEPAVD